MWRFSVECILSQSICVSPWTNYSEWFLLPLNHWLIWMDWLINKAFHNKELDCLIYFVASGRLPIYLFIFRLFYFFFCIYIIFLYWVQINYDNKQQTCWTCRPNGQVIYMQLFGEPTSQVTLATCITIHIPCIYHDIHVIYGHVGLQVY